MKKGNSLAVFRCLLPVCLVLGIFVGRNLTGNYQNIPSDKSFYTVVNQKGVQDYRLDINTATKVQLMELPEIGEVIADRILNYRVEIGKFESIDDLLNVTGIGEKTLQKIEMFITVGG